MTFRIGLMFYIAEYMFYLNNIVGIAGSISSCINQGIVQLFTELLTEIGSNQQLNQN